MRATRSLATAAAAAALLLSAAPSAAAAAAAPPGDEASDAVAAIIASHLQQRTDKERELNSCFNGAYVAMAQGAWWRGAGGTPHVATVGWTRKAPLGVILTPRAV